MNDTPVSGGTASCQANETQESIAVGERSESEQSPLKQSRAAGLTRSVKKANETQESIAVGERSESEQSPLKQSRS
ncbi:hypothetical protein, partial [Elongatibacter sediminis]